MGSGSNGQERLVSCRSRLQADILMLCSWEEPIKHQGQKEELDESRYYWWQPLKKRGYVVVAIGIKRGGSIFTFLFPPSLRNWIQQDSNSKTPLQRLTDDDMQEGRQRNQGRAGAVRSWHTRNGGT